MYQRHNDLYDDVILMVLDENNTIGRLEWNGEASYWRSVAFHTTVSLIVSHQSAPSSMSQDHRHDYYLVNGGLPVVYCFFLFICICIVGMYFHLKSVSPTQ
jgi:hypothetical protein